MYKKIMYKKWYEDPPENVYRLVRKHLKEISKLRRKGIVWGEIAKNFKNISPDHISTAYCRLLKT